MTKLIEHKGKTYDTTDPKYFGPDGKFHWGMTMTLQEITDFHDEMVASTKELHEIMEKAGIPHA